MTQVSIFKVACSAHQLMGYETIAETAPEMAAEGAEDDLLSVDLLAH